MSPKPKKSQLTVRYEPMKGNFFDIKPPVNQKTYDIKEGGSRTFNEMWRFFLMAFAIFLIFVALGVYGNGQNLIRENKSIAYAGYDDLKAGAKLLVNQDFSRANMLFKGAEFAFKEVDRNLYYLTSQAKSFIQSDLYLDAAQKLIESGVAVSKIGQELTVVLDEVRQIPHLFIQQNQGENPPVHLTDLVRTQKRHLDSILLETLLIQKNITTLNSNALPTNLQKNIQVTQDYIGKFLAALKEINQNFETALALLGDKVPHRYLVLLQNNHELRATGGFIGSYMLVDVNDGEITKIETKDIYETDGQLTEKVTPPAGINLVADRWYMRDANYSPDFPTSAQKIMWFLENSQGPSVDTVIAIDQTVAEKLLELTGPINSKAFPFIIRADNFNALFSFHIESKLSKTATPKQLLIDFIPLFKESLLSLEDFSDLNDIVLQLVYGRHIQVYSNDMQIQTLSERLHMDGRIIASDPAIDYLGVVTTAIGGNKSDRYIDTNLTHHTEVDHKGVIVDHLTIQKTHTWEEEDFAYWKKLISRYGTGKLSEETLRFIQGEGDNVDYMRVYVPKDSRLVGLDGIDLEDLDVYKDLGYTVFAFNFGSVPAGQSKTVNLSYRPPFTLDFNNPKTVFDTYRFITQKQAGAQNITLKKSLQTSQYLQVLETYPKIEITPFTLYPEFETALDQNKIFLSAIAAQ